MPKLPSIANSIANSYQIKKNEGSGENGQVIVFQLAYSEQSVVNSRRDWYDHSGKLLT